MKLKKHNRISHLEFFNLCEWMRREGSGMASGNYGDLSAMALAAKKSNFII